MWFKPVGLFHLPVSWQGMMITILGFIFSIHVFIAIDKNSHSVSDTLYVIFPFFACTFLLYEWIAGNRS
jgi:hypothetical protein